MQHKDIESVTLFRTWIEIADALKNDAERGKLYHALCRYSLYGEIPKLAGLLSSYFTIMRPSIDKSNKRKIAQLESLQKRLQNDMPKGLQNDLQNNKKESLQKRLQNDMPKGLQNDLQNNKKEDLQKRLQNDLQNSPTRPRKTGTETKTGKKTGSKEPAKETVSFVDLIPEKFRTKVFMNKWMEWESCRRTARKPLSVKSATMQLSMLSGHAEPEAIAIMNTSIMNGYQGLFPPKNQPAQVKQHAGKDDSGI